ncbi:hypothetical protein [Streptomyces sp. NPDC020965]|uniref:hypothetical protein n=1 Tax=Streptomyces sp. NPDC020965 TaxID=3365105 RepID=UPI00378D5EAF
MTGMSSVDLQLPLLPPVPVAGCGVCAVLAERRTAHLRVGDFSGATDRSVQIRRHDAGHGGE